MSTAYPRININRKTQVKISVNTEDDHINSEKKKKIKWKNDKKSKKQCRITDFNTSSSVRNEKAENVTPPDTRNTQRPTRHCSNDTTVIAIKQCDKPPA